MEIYTEHRDLEQVRTIDGRGSPGACGAVRSLPFVVSRHRDARDTLLGRNSMRQTLTRAAIASLLLTTAPASAQFDQLLKGLPSVPSPPGTQTRGVGDVKIGAALKQALQVATENAVTLTGKTDGYFMNQAIKILIPERLKALENGLRAIGYGEQVDDFVLSMNRAAERAAPAVKQIFWDAIGELTIDDSRKILGGGDTAATKYFKGKTTDRLTTAFHPVVDKAMNEVGVARRYNDLLGQAKAIPFFRTEDYDLDHYVVGKALDGLFHVVGDEEKKIRTMTRPRLATWDVSRDC